MVLRVMGLWTNRQLIRKTLKEEGISLRRSLKLEAGNTCVYALSKKKEITIPFAPTSKTMLIFAHELGHHKHPEGFAEDKMTAELSAWVYGFAWLRARDVTLTLEDYGFASWAIYSYFKDTPRNTHYYYLDIFLRLWVKYYLHDSDLMKEIQNGKV